MHIVPVFKIMAYVFCVSDACEREMPRQDACPIDTVPRRLDLTKLNLVHVYGLPRWESWAMRWANDSISGWKSRRMRQVLSVTKNE